MTVMLGFAVGLTISIVLLKMVQDGTHSGFVSWSVFFKIGMYLMMKIIIHHHWPTTFFYISIGFSWVFQTSIKVSVCYGPVASMAPR